MKKFLIFAFLSLIVSQRVFSAGGGSLTIVNHNTCCTLACYMYGIAAAEGNSAGCDLVSCVITIPPSTTVSWNTPYDFAFGGVPSPPPNFCFETSLMGIATWLSIADFMWTDVQFQWTCGECPPLPPPGCSGGGSGTMSEQISTACPVFSACFGSPASWLAPTWASCTTNATWTSSTPGCVMSNVTLDFY